MSPDRPVLGFDTAGRHCSVALIRRGKVLAFRHIGMERGQAEALFPTIDQVLGEAGCDVGDACAIGVGTGPGSFTGVRFGVAAARGLSLALGIPAIGITAFEIAAFGSPGPTLVILEAPNGYLFVRPVPDGEPVCIEPSQLENRFGRRMPVTGDRSSEFAERLGTGEFVSHAAAGVAASLIAERRMPWKGLRPKPLYLRPAVAGCARMELQPD